MGHPVHDPGAQTATTRDLSRNISYAPPCWEEMQEHNRMAVLSFLRDASHRTEPECSD